MHLGAQRAFSLPFRSSFRAYASHACERSVFLIGPTGVGKSWLGNKLLAKGQKPFKASASNESVTVKVKDSWSLRKLRVLYRGEQADRDLKLTVHDTPGLADTQGRSTEFLDEILTSIKQEKPHGLVMVVKNDRDTKEFELAMAVLAECLEVVLHDSRRAILVVNKLPTDASIEDDDDVADRDEYLHGLAHEKRRSVSKLLRLGGDFQLTLAGVQQDSKEEGISNVLHLISEMPNEGIDTDKLRTFTQVKKDAEKALGDSESAKEAVVRRENTLNQRLENIKANKKYYEDGAGDYTQAGGAALSVVAGVCAFIPGVNVVAAGAACASAAAASAKATYNKNELAKLTKSLAEAERDMQSFHAAGGATNARQEVARLQEWLDRINKLQRDIDNKS